MPPAPPADTCKGTLEVEGAVIVMPFFLGAIDDDEDDDEADEIDVQSADSGSRKRSPYLVHQRCHGYDHLWGHLAPLQFG